MNDLCEKFNCYIVFDTINNTINLYAQNLITKFIGDGKNNIFIITPPFKEIGTVSIDGYKTTKWNYNYLTGELSFIDIPKSGSLIEVIDKSLSNWETDVFITYENLAQEVQIDYDADSIKTVLSVSYGNNEDIRETNLGLPYLTDISYYYTKERMGPELFEVYTEYFKKTNDARIQYTQNSQKLLDLANKIYYEQNRLSLSYSVAQNVTSTTVGKYYTRHGESPNYYYVEVNLPQDYQANITYYSLDIANVNETKMSNLYTVLKKYYNSEEDWKTELEKLRLDFQFVENFTFDDLLIGLQLAENLEKKDSVVLRFLKEVWKELGKVPLTNLYYEPYKKIQITNIEAGWSEKDNNNYWYYYPNTLYLRSIEDAIKLRKDTINMYTEESQTIQKENLDISNSLILKDFFKNYFNNKYPDPDKAEKVINQSLIRINSFLREDELKINDIFTTVLDTPAETFKVKQDAMESGKIELQRISQPRLKFSMSMANIYALKEFEPIINQFQLGNVIKVGIRRNYIKHSRLLKVNINFEDFSNFSCEFGELTGVKTQSDIEADLLSGAITAGQTVATNSNYWTQGSEQANSTDLKIEQGLLDAVTQIKSTEGIQDAVIDKYGIRLLKNTGNGEIDPEQIWFVNNKIVFTDDAFKTSKAALGKVTVDGKTYYGLISELVLSGYIEGSVIKGGTIKIGEQPDGSYAFEVREDGSVNMGGGNTINGYAKEDDLDQTNQNVSGLETEMNTVKKDIANINALKLYDVQIYTNDPTIFTTPEDSATLYCKVTSWDADITDSVPAQVFRWKRVSNDNVQDMIWNNTQGHAGVKSITITCDDISENSSFVCEIDLPELQRLLEVR